MHDADKRLTSATTAAGESAQFVYDGLGRCVKRTINGVPTVFTYDGWNPMLEWDDAGNFQAWNVYGARADEILMRHSTIDGDVLYHADPHGDVKFLLDWSGNGLEKYTYDAFGGPTVTNWDGSGARNYSNYGNRFMFTGREWLPQLGLYDYRNRFYQPELGRFLQTDPIGFAGGDTNLFRYCGGDPVNRADPTGLHSNSEAPDWNAMPLRTRTFYAGVANVTVGTISGFGVASAGTLTFGAAAPMVIVMGPTAIFTTTKGMSQIVSSLWGTNAQVNGANSMPGTSSSAAALILPENLGNLLQFLELVYAAKLSAGNIGPAMSAPDILDAVLNAQEILKQIAGAIRPPPTPSQPFAHVEFGLPHFAPAGGIGHSGVGNSNVGLLGATDANGNSLFGSFFGLGVGPGNVDVSQGGTDNYLKHKPDEQH